MIDRQTVERIMGAADIVEVISEFVTLRKAGSNWKGLCPFHDEKTPSFMVSPSKGICKCFSCGKGGSVVHFLMEHEQLSYPDALRWLARKYHIEIKEHELTEEDIRQNNLRESLLIITAWADGFFQQQLHETQEGQSIGLSYFRNRGLQDDTIRTFRLGYCPSKGNVVTHEAVKKGYNEDFLIQTGITNRNEQGELYDKYRSRVIYPIQALDGKVIGFGARTLSSRKDIAKYMNSPESVIYDKSNGVLYGLYQAKREIQKQDLCFLVEGYMDVISMHQNGVRNVVASSGTSLTYGQIRLIRRFTSNVTVIYDGDSAGIKASLRGIDMLLSQGMNIRILLLPDGDDPDSFSRKHTAEDFQKYIQSHQVDFIRFKAGILMQEVNGDPIRKSQAVRSIVESISAIRDPLMRSTYVRECSSLLGEREDVLIHEITVKRRQSQTAGQMTQATQNAQTPQPKENSTAPAAGETPGTTVVPDQTPTIIRQKETNIVQTLIRYGEEILYQIEDENGEKQNIKVAEFIQTELNADEIKLQTPWYQSILDETIAGIQRPDFVAARHFLDHPNSRISHLASMLLSDRYQMSEEFAKDMRISSEKEDLSDSVPLLIIDLKLAIVTLRMKNILHSIQSASSPEEMQERMQTYSQLKDVQQQLTALGGDKTILM